MLGIGFCIGMRRPYAVARLEGSARARPFDGFLLKAMHGIQMWLRRSVGNWVAPAQLDESLVEGQRDDVVVVVTRHEHATEDLFHVGPPTYASQLEIAQPQLQVGEPRLSTVGIKNVDCRRKTIAGLYGCHSHASIVWVMT